MEQAPRVIVRTEYVSAPIPANLTDCDTPMPEGVATMGDVKAYLVALHQAAVNCELDAAATKSISSDSR